MKVVDAADVVIEVLDARDPLGCRCLDVERLVRKSGADKKVILLLNKIGKRAHMSQYSQPGSCLVIIDLFSNLHCTLKTQETFIRAFKCCALTW